jgi:two-component system phosphate regulon response regulator OmpR
MSDPAELPAPMLADEAPHLLVVDDDARIRSLLSRYLSDNGFRVDVAANGAEARTHLGGLAFDLLVIDVMMPGETGFELLKSLRETMQVPVLMLTARSETDDRINGFELGADDYLTKPFEPRELLLRINAILKRGAAVASPLIEQLRFGPFVFHLGRRELKRGSDPIRLTVDVQINRLRRKIEVDPANPLYLQTVRGIGYRLVTEA